jgi:2-oxoglutarate ferredoxin oxidoreductase subunit alpha
VLTKAELDAMPRFYRYSPTDELEVAARTVPGVDPKGSFFTRGSGHNKLGGYTEIPAEYADVMARLLRKHTQAKKLVPEAIVELRRGPAGEAARFGVVTVGGCDLAVREALELLSARGVVADYMRVRAFPFGDEVQRFLDAHDRVFVVEQNRDAQLRTLLTIETTVPKEKLSSVLAWGGFPLQASQVIEGITSVLGGGKEVRS